MTLWPAVVLLLLGVLSRLGAAFAPDQWPMHFNALTALALCGATLLPRPWLAAGLSLIILGVSDLIINAHYGLTLLDSGNGVRYLSLAVIALMGVKLHEKGWSRRFGPRVGASLAASTLFYVATNTACWALSPSYPAGATGWWMALSTGLPGYPPSWTFFRNALVGDLAFTALFFGCARLGEKIGQRAPVFLPTQAVR